MLVSCLTKLTIRAIEQQGATSDTAKDYQVPTNLQNRHFTLSGGCGCTAGWYC